MKKDRPPFNPDTFDGTNYFWYCDESTHLGWGTDSTVDRVHPDWVLKRYNKHMTMDKLRLYDQFMSELGSYVINLHVQAGMFGSLTFAVEPMHRMFQAKDSAQVMAICRYRDGKHFGAGENKALDDFFKTFSQEVGRALGYGGVEISTPNTKYFQTNMSVLYWAQHLCTITDGCDFISHLKKL